MIRERLRNAVNFTDSATARRARTPTPPRKAKPAGVLGAEIWVNIVAVGNPTPTDPTSFIFRRGSPSTRGRPIC